MKARAALLCLSLASAGCGPQAIDVRSPFSFSAEQARAALKQQMPPALLAAVGGALPEQWPADAPRLLVDLLVIGRARVELEAVGADPSRFAALRLRAARATTGGPVGLIQPPPGELLLFAGPLGATSLSDPGVRRLARGAFPVAGTQIDCTPPPCPPLTTDGGAALEVSQALGLEPAARGALEELVLGAGAFELLLALRVPIDSAADPLAPRGAAAVEVGLDLELAP